MQFFVSTPTTAWPAHPDSFLLRVRDWNDWFEFRTTFSLSYIDAEGGSTQVGLVKIADLQHTYVNAYGQETPLGSYFEQLDTTRYVSVGQDESYYENLRALVGPNRAREALRALGDLAENPARLDELRTAHRVVSASLMREVATVTITGKYNRIIENGGGLAGFDFVFTQPSQSDIPVAPTELSFAVNPGSHPPTNVHVLIGRNGSGKTTLLRSMARAMLGPTVATPADGRFTTRDGGRLDIANLVYVAFSAFDEAKLPVLSKQLQYDIAYSYVGLQYIPGLDEDSFGPEMPEPFDRPKATRAPIELADQFVRSARKVMAKEGLRTDWHNALVTLESDPNFAEAELTRLTTGVFDPIDEEAIEVWSKLSTGHRIVLLTVTKLVETVTERTMVLLDEPEGHLHPPLLSALIRTLSDLLQARNGVAIVATHSPVILQEVPQRCAWKIRRVGLMQVAEPILIETFGESVGVLTSEGSDARIGDRFRLGREGSRLG